MSLNAIARKPETFLTIQEIVSAEKVNGDFESKNGIAFKKVVIVAMVENSYVDNDQNSSIVIHDGGNDPVWITAF